MFGGSVKDEEDLPDNYWADAAYRKLVTQEAFDAVLTVPKAERKAKYEGLIIKSKQEHKIPLKGAEGVTLEHPPRMVLVLIYHA